MLFIKRKFKIGCDIHYKQSIINILDRHNVAHTIDGYHESKINGYTWTKVYFDCICMENELQKLIEDLDKHTASMARVTLIY